MHYTKLEVNRSWPAYDPPTYCVTGCFWSAWYFQIRSVCRTSIKDSHKSIWPFTNDIFTHEDQDIKTEYAAGSNIPVNE